MCVSYLCSFLGLLLLPQKWDSFLSVSHTYSDTLERDAGCSTSAGQAWVLGVFHHTSLPLP